MSETANICAPTHRNRSSEEFTMRAVIEAWGRPRWPDARLVHELVVGQCRIDMAFIRPDQIIGVEIKSSKDVMDRAEKQTTTFTRHLQTVIVAVAPKWKDLKHGFLPHWNGCETVCCGDEVTYPFLRLKCNRAVTSAMLELLWASEARQIAGRFRVPSTQSTPLYKLLPELARKLTGDEIVAQVCQELRARDAFPKGKDHPPSYPPIRETMP